TPGSETGPDAESHPGSYVGVAGNFVLLNYKDSGQQDSVISFDNAEVFDSANIVLDDFNDNVKTAWTDTLNGGTVSEANMQFELKTAPVNITAFTATRKTTQTFQIQDGGRVEFSIDVINNVAADVHRFAVLGYLPAASGVSALKAYHIAQSQNRIYVGKEYNRWWAAGDPSPNQNNVRLIQSYIGEGASVRVTTRIEDLNADVNDPGRILYQNEFLDTAGADAGIVPNGDSGAAYTNADGFFLLYAFNESGGPATGTDVIYDNVLVSYAVVGAANISPGISD